jgi:hypothetical protein
LKEFFRHTVVKYDLHDAGFIPEIAENQSAKVSSSLDPAVERNLRADILFR